MKHTTILTQPEATPPEKQNFDNRISAVDIALEKQISKKRVAAAAVRELCGVTCPPRVPRS